MINAKIQRLAWAIMIAEGWDSTNNSLTYRNHNPGALRSSPFALGTRGGFAYFLNDNVGFWALCWDLAKKCRGETVTGLTPQSTIEELVRVYTAETDLFKIKNYVWLAETITGKKKETKLEYFVNI